MSSSYKNVEIRKDCLCGWVVFVQKSWTNENPRRRFVACSDYELWNKHKGLQVVQEDRQPNDDMIKGYYLEVDKWNN